MVADRLFTLVTLLSKSDAERNAEWLHSVAEYTRRTARPSPRTSAPLSRLQNHEQ
jgi:hypothetical protein